MSSADLLSRTLSSRSRKALAALSAIAIAAAALVLYPGTSNAQIDGTRAYDTLYSGSVVGDVTFAANSLVLNAQTKIYADSDGDATTSNSSTATLDIPVGATVKGAWLHWMGKTKGAGATAQAAPATEADAVAWIKRPGDTAYQILNSSPQALHLTKFTDTGADADATNDINVWMASSDITSLVTASGSYTVSVPFLSGAEAPEMAGWNMTVVYSLPVGTPGAKLRNITVVDGFDSLVTGENVAFASDQGLQTAAGVQVNVGVAGLGGDAGMSDYLRVAAGATASTGSDVTNALNPMPATTNISSDIFNGTISKNGVDVTTRTPAYSPSGTPGVTPGTGFTAMYDKSGSLYQSPNDFGNDYSAGFDSDIFNVSSAFTAAPTQVSVQFGPSATAGGTGGKDNDTIYPAVATLAVDIAAPYLSTTVDIADLDTANPGIGVGDKVKITIASQNIGPEAGKAAAITATLPAGLLYARDSAVVTAGSLNAGTKSDVVSSASSPVDGYSYDAGSRKITWNLGVSPQYALQANAADGVQTLTFEAYVTDAVRTAHVAPATEDFDPIVLSVRSEAVSALEADGSAPSVASSTGFATTMDQAGVSYIGTPRHDLNLTNPNVVLEAITASSGRIRFKVLNNGPVSTSATVKWEYNSTEFTPTTAGVTGATCTTAVVSGTTSALSCALTDAVASMGISTEITVPLAFLKDRSTLQPGKIWVVKTGASSPDTSDIDATNKYSTNTLYEKTAQGATTWPAIPQAAPFVVTADNYNVGFNLPLTITAANGLLKNDTGAGLSIVSNTNAVMAGETTARGTLAVAADGSFTYTAPADFKGTLTFTYSVKSTDYPKKADGTDRIEVGTVTLQVADKTEAIADTYYTPKATELVVPVAKGLFSNDLGTPFTLTTLTGSDSKTATVAVDGSFTLTTTGGVIRGTKSDGSFTYTPNATFVGKDVITYAATDTFGSSKNGTVTIEVVEKPVLEDDTVEATGGKLNFDPLKNDKGTGLKVTSFDKTSKEGGTIVQEIDGTLTFTPKTGYFGTDSFTYTVTDAAGQTSVGTVSVVIPEALAYTGDHVLAPVSAGWLLLVAAFMFFLLSSRRMAPVSKP